MRRTSSFIWQRSEWPQFRWDGVALLDELATARHAQGLFLGRMRGLGFELRRETQTEALTEEAVKSSAIEGETIDARSVRSSLARQLGLPLGGLRLAVGKKEEALARLMLDATTHYAKPLTKERLWEWHRALFPEGGSALHPVRVGRWRNDAEGPMQVISGPIGRARVHFEAPPAHVLPAQMRRFLSWMNARAREDGLLRAGIAHLWFVTLHPFDDGNGRIARAITDLALAQLEASPQRFYSMSSQILRERAAYYAQLERTQRGGLDVTEWLAWFLGCYRRAIASAEQSSLRVFERASFWEKFAREAFSLRQKKVLNRLLDDFEGPVTTKKWAALGKTSIDSAQRDINDLLERGILVKNPGGSKHTSYSLDVSGHPLR